MYQAGIKEIILYENKGINFIFYDSGNAYAITSLTNTGSKIVLENLKQPEFDIKLKFSDGGNVVQDFKIEFYILGLTLESYELLSQLKTSIYGWCFLVEFYDGTLKFYNSPVYCKDSEIKPHEEMSFKVTMQTAVPTRRHYYEYSKNIFIPYYRADSEILTADSEILTADYEL